MTNTKPTRPQRSEKTRALIREKALVRGGQISDDVGGKVRAVMKEMEIELAIIRGTNSAYALPTKADVARRAEIHPTTFYTEKQRALGKEVTDWLESLKNPDALEPTAVRRTPEERASEWKRQFDALAQSHRDTELELAHLSDKLKKALADNEALRQEIDELKYSSANVIRLHHNSGLIK